MYKQVPVNFKGTFKISFWVWQRLTLPVVAVSPETLTQLWHLVICLLIDVTLEVLGRYGSGAVCYYRNPSLDSFIVTKKY